MYRPLQKFSSSYRLSLRGKEPVSPCLSDSPFTGWALIILGVLALVLGIVLLACCCSRPVASSAAVSLMVSGFIFVVCTVVLAVRKAHENRRSTALMPRLEAGRRAESAFHSSKIWVLASTKL